MDRRTWFLVLSVLGIMVMSALMYAFFYFGTLPGASPSPSPTGQVVELEGIVQTVNANAQVIVVSISGGAEQFLALQNTKLYNRDGKETSLSSIIPGTHIRAQGIRSNSETVIPWEIRILIAGSPSATPTLSTGITSFNVYFGNSNLDSEATCNKVFSVRREVPQTQSVAREALRELLRWPTRAEKAEGYFTSMNSGIMLRSIRIENETAYVDFDERLEFQVGGSCRVAAIRAEITETLRQFPTVQNVVISIRGRIEDILQP